MLIAASCGDQRIRKTIGSSGIQTFPTSRDWRKRLAKAKTKTATKWHKCFTGFLHAGIASIGSAFDQCGDSQGDRTGVPFSEGRLGFSGTLATAGTTLFVEGRGREVDASLSVPMADVFAMLTNVRWLVGF